ncbi:MAG TPA: helicase HerA-like domain-containing protein, partial [Geminicoccaceae bacterium]
MSNDIFLGRADGPQTLRLDRANRHGVVAGATGTGKTVTLQIMAEGFAEAGVPVFCADVKGDLSGIAVPGAPSEKMRARAADLGLELTSAAPPVICWDLFGENGHPIRATVSEMGPLLLSRLLELNDTQEGVMTIAFHVADEEGLLLLDLDDLQSLLQHVGQNAREIGQRFGNVAPATIGTIQRKLLAIRSQGGEHFFGEPALDLKDLMRTTRDGRGYVNILAADQLITSPRLYSTFLLWLLSELFEELPEVGDPEKPKLVFFFDEAHLLFRDAPKPLLEKVEQVVRLIRSKGVGVYFVTQNPADIPEGVLAQLGARVQHALRAYTPAEQRGLKAAAETFRQNPSFSTEKAITELAVGEALVSTLDEQGAPTVVARTAIRPPCARLGPLSPQERAAVMAASPLAGVYDQRIDRDSAHERLAARAEETLVKVIPPRPRAVEPEPEPEPAPSRTRAAPRPPAPARRSDSMGDAFAKSFTRSFASAVAGSIARSILGSP